MGEDFVGLKNPLVCHAPKHISKAWSGRGRSHIGYGVTMCGWGFLVIREAFFLMQYPGAVLPPCISSFF